MTLHFIHVGKTGGTVIKRALRRRGLSYRAREAPHGPETPYGRIQVHLHRFTMRDLPNGDYAFFFLRDPVERYLSGFSSRLNKGLPGHYFEWTGAESRAFEAFPTPQRLAAALGSPDEHERELARWAMRHIRHLGFMERAVGTPPELRTRRSQIVYVGMQETLDADWEQLKAILELPADVALPTDKRRANRRDPSQKASLDPAAEQLIRDWYHRDYVLLTYCHRLRAWRGWDPAPRQHPGATTLHRLRGLPAVVPPADEAVRLIRRTGRGARSAVRR